MPKTDEQLADTVPKTRFWRKYIQYMRHWEISSFVRSALKEKGLERDLFPLEFEKTVQRVSGIIRGRRAKNAARTRRRNRERQRQLTLPL